MRTSEQIAELRRKGLLACEPKELMLFSEQFPLDCSETRFSADVKFFAESIGYKCYHPYRSDKSEPGYPDWTFVRNRIFFAELKRHGNKPTKDQIAWAQAIKNANGEHYFWWPRDWTEIRSVLLRTV